MPLSWNEIKNKAVEFSTTWADASNEDADAKPFLSDFFKVFGIESRKFGSFEHRVKKLDDRDGYIDLLWKQNILVEMKSRGKDLEKAYVQAMEYIQGLKQSELPKLILISDFENFNLYDLEEGTTASFKLNELIHNVDRFSYIAGYQKKIYKEQDPVNIKAAELMGKFHDRLKEIGYEGHALELYLVRILFCLFAEDTAIFNKQQFQDYIEQRTSEDGSDLASRLQELFQVLNTSEDKRFKNLDEQLQAFPYVNGKLFEENLAIASFDAKMRQSLLECCYIDWSRISPAIFGAMFQSVMNPEERRNLGAHYTSEKNILKLIRPLFLDELWKEFEASKNSDNKLQALHVKISKLKFLDPACGCGNFLVITYRELRLLELEILRTLNKHGQVYLNINEIVLLDVDMMYGIECEEFPAQIAQVAMWLIDHQMNLLISNEFGQYFARLPLKKSANIIQGNALRIDWENIVSKSELSYILGNPPFIGSKFMNASQREEITTIFNNSDGCGLLDYVTGWYMKAAKYIQNTNIKTGLVSTNSIVQGEQTSILWGQLINKFGIKIHFAHRTFKWSNEAKGNAAVYCVIIGFANIDTDNKCIFYYEDIKGEAHELKVKNINSYLVDAKDVLINKTPNPICDVPPFIIGSKPLDGGHLCLTPSEKDELLNNEPLSGKFIKPLIGAREFLYNEKRYCLWLVDATPTELKNMKYILRRLKAVKEDRENGGMSKKSCVDKPHLFGDNRQPQSNFLVIPKLSSENRKYIPMGFFDQNTIITDLVSAIPNANLYHFGVLSSLDHMVWVKYTCGRMKSDFRYTNLVYNNYPWPENPSDKNIKLVEDKAQAVLDVRKEFPDSSLADLYDPLTMPPKLVKAHNELDKAVDLCYRSQPFVNETKRIEFLFELYEKYTAGMFKVEKKKKNKAVDGESTI
ncbi:MAG: SAM-dependent methyltransferase [Spirochaetae bacterium HGW-Spirochaetae-5]|nr:MAG: SAM-dependent methyltransferase [Spirochaetae bacterium HGW-Spirochaetae-5]